jgi:flavin-dependent dehydrogenase
MNTYDAIIIGGGPGGSTAGSALARAGKKVLILERDRFPRFHVGESLIPYGNDELRRIGVWEKLERGGFMPKLGAEFVLGNARAGIHILFGRHLPPSYAQTFQVERARFDNLLLDHAAASGCEVWQETRVDSFSVSSDGVKVACIRGGQKHELSARWLLDASGREAVVGKKLDLPKTDFGMPKKFATFAHFCGVKRNDPPADGHITVARMDFGWFWIIPLDAEKTSVGLVQTLEHFRQTGLKPGECFEKVVASTTELRRRMAQAERVSEYSFAGDYTYRHLENAGPRWLLIGDAAGFIDPIFSSGVMMAIKSGYLAATEVLAADQAGTALSVKAQRRYTKKVGQMCGVFLNMIKMFYNRHAFELFMSPDPEPRAERAVYNVVAGNTDLTWQLKFRIGVFYTLCFLQRWIPFSPRLQFKEDTAEETSVARAGVP